MFRIAVRHCSGAQSKAQTKISWNKDNKELFGAVIKRQKNVKKSKAKDQDADHVIPKNNTITSKPNESVLSSEMHWMLGSAHNRKRMFMKPYDNTERIALKVPSPIVDDDAEQGKSGALPPLHRRRPFDAILRIPLINHESSALPQIPELVDTNQMPSVGKILQATMSDAARNALIQWKLAKVAELGDEGFAQLQKENLSRGLRFHNLLQDYFTTTADDRDAKELVAEDDPNYPVWKSVQSVLPEIDRDAVFVEKRVQHPVLRYKGVVDCVSTIG